MWWGYYPKKTDWTPETVSFAGNLPVSIATLAEQPGYPCRIVPHPVVIAGVFANNQTLASFCALLLGLGKTQVRPGWLCLADNDCAVPATPANIAAPFEARCGSSSGRNLVQQNHVSASNHSKGTCKIGFLQTVAAIGSDLFASDLIVRLRMTSMSSWKKLYTKVSPN